MRPARTREARDGRSITSSFGLGVPQSYAEAFKWFHLAADQGIAVAQATVGQMYADGEGVLQDYVLAHMCSTWPPPRAINLLRHEETSLPRT